MTGDRRRVPSLIVSIVAVFTISATLLVSHSNETLRGKDDAYITYQYAKNIAHGHGFVFNVGDGRTLGTSTPLYAGLLALGARLGLSIPLLSIAIGPWPLEFRKDQDGRLIGLQPLAHCLQGSGPWGWGRCSWTSLQS